MKNLWKRLRLRKPDEMEQAILFRAQRNAYFFLAAALFIWSVYESCQVYLHHTRLNLLPCLLLVGAVGVQGFTQAILTRRAVQGDEDSWETGPLLRLIVLVCAAVGVLVTVAAAFVLMAVRV